jgi:hypothetical protein
MKIISTRTRIALFVSAIVLLLQISPALAGGPVAITYTKWVTNFPCPCLMTGYTGGDVPGVFSGEALERQVSLNGHVVRIEAMYEVQDNLGERSFTALIRGGTSGVTGAAVLDGVILAGWRTGAQVHVEFQTKTNCEGAPPGTCFQGTIYVEQAPGQ